MVELYSLVNELEEDEIRYIKNALRKTETCQDEFFLLQKLFDSILIGGINSLTPDEDLSKKIYQNNNSAAFSKLKSRLFQFILDALSSDHLICKETSFDTTDRQNIKIRKRMLQFRILYRKKNRADIKVLYHLLNEIIKGAREFEQYDILVEALHFKKYLLMLRKGFDEIKKIKEQINYYQYVHQGLLKANDYYFDLITNQSMVQKLDCEQVSSLIKEALGELDVYVKKTDSNSIKYIYKIISLEAMMRNRNYTQTIDICLDIISLLENSPALYTKERMGFVHDNISLCLVCMNDFKNAIINSKKAQSYYSPRSISYVLSMQQEFYANFYAGKYEEALQVIENMLRFEVINKGEFRHDKFKFLRACVLFKLNRKKEAISICNQVLEITKDKARWDLGIRYLKLMCLFETKDSEAIFNSLEALRKNLNRTKINGKMRETKRDELLYKVFSDLTKIESGRSSTEKFRKNLEKLSDESGEYSWAYYSCEIIPVHYWIQSIINKKIRSGSSLVLKR
jgi:tetratricopeptide (TPR) repeat protein